MDSNRDDENMFDETDPDKQKMDVVVGMYNTIYEMYLQLDNDDYGEVEKEISEMWRLINEAIEQLPPKAKPIARDRIVFGLSLSEIEKQNQELSHDRIERLWSASLIAIGEYLDSHEIYGFSYHPNGSASSTMKFSKEQIQYYVDIVLSVAQTEYGLMDCPNDSLSLIDTKELISIGIIAVEVLIKNKTPEQLERYNTFYIATAVRWAIKNELRIRYEWYKECDSDGYKEDEKMFDETNPEVRKFRVGISIDRNIYLIYKQIEREKIKNNESLNEIENEFVSRWRLLEKGMKTLSKKEQIIAKNLIVDGFTLEMTMEINEVGIEDCVAVFEKIKQYLKDKGVEGL